jgi:hypothetical protein
MSSRLVVIPGMNPATPTSRKATPTSSDPVWTGVTRSTLTSTSVRVRMSVICAPGESGPGDRGNPRLPIRPVTDTRVGRATAPGRSRLASASRRDNGT